MASFMSMQYDSDSDSADDLDFEPASGASSGSDSDSGPDMDETMGDEIVEDEVMNGDTVVEDLFAKPAKKTRKKGTPASAVTKAVTPDASAISVPATATPATSATSTAAPMQDVVPSAGVAVNATAEAAAPAPGAPLSANDSNAPAPGEVAKKKKGPKKGTKYKKRTPAVAADGSKPAGKTPKASKMTKKAAAAAAAAAAEAETEAVRQKQAEASVSGRFGFLNTQVDIDHPLETFKWPYSPFTPEFKSQHQARNKMANDLHQAVQEMTDNNNRATWHLQELDNQLQISRQGLRTSLDEIQFRKSQLRDMSLLAVDIVRKLSSPRQRPPPPPRTLSSSSSSGTASGTESAGGDGGETGGYGSSYKTTVSHLDGDRMEVDDVESGEEQYGQMHGQGREQQQSQQQQQQSLKGLNEGNVRSFLEKIRELELAQRHVVV
ncbi:hypothetical protein BC939DRAFT_531886 [Gamsiella multidivaricata]|uniref:uncharacterized protein n=1 Tax=Gamsiella multidivaricata TaxID=101098 RepID=UPI00221EB223|nr:uncharacterized protein BC939DRAFT_531886 [Gamsiella multidivaricata]KAG0366076.1 hypothetical protein BGZ54_005859 [Gamsiella multidivaricata]KAI7818564.1 hypothetical protein BC939DRAFT_531886 [Gamsiella multidivaricata]